MRWFLESAVVRVVAGFILAAAVLAFGGWLVTGQFREYPLSFDSGVRTAMRQMQSPMWASLFLTVTNFGSTIYLWIIGTVAGIIFIFMRWFRPLLLLMLVMSGQGALDQGFKWLIARPRPPALVNYKTLESFSFPSGHAIASLCLYVTIAWIITSQLENSAAKAGVWISAAILVFLTGASRVYIGVHYPTDVIAGFLAGAIWTTAVMSVGRRQL